MSRKKLTLSVDESAIRSGRRFSRRHGTSISNLVSDFLSSLDDEADQDSRVVARLRGILPSSVDASSYREHLETKYGA